MAAPRVPWADEQEERCASGKGSCLQWAAPGPETMLLGQIPRTALCVSSAKVYVGVKQEIAEMRIPALNAYMKVRRG